VVNVITLALGCAEAATILLDEVGNLALIKLSPQGMKVIANASVLAHTTWTPPILTGTNLYMRDHKMMVALDLK